MTIISQRLRLVIVILFVRQHLSIQASAFGRETISHESHPFEDNFSKRYTSMHERIFGNTYTSLQERIFGNINFTYNCDGRDVFLVGGRCYYLHYRELSYKHARQFCQKSGQVLARIYSTSQLQSLTRNIDPYQRYSRRLAHLWVGASNRGKGGRFLWLADNSELKRDSSLWYTEPSIWFQDPEDEHFQKRCVEIYSKTRLSDAPCNIRKSFLCMALHDGLLSMSVNNTEMPRNQVIQQDKGKSLDIRCDLLHEGLDVHSTFLTLTMDNKHVNDEDYTSDNKTSLNFHIPVTTCDDSGTYICNANFEHRTVVVSSSISLNVEPCSSVTHESSDASKRPVCSGPDTELSEGSCFRYFNKYATYTEAEDFCRYNGGVLAAFKSLSQMQSIFAEWNFKRGFVWVGASNLQDVSSFIWIANKKRLRSDSPMWSSEETREQGLESCIARNQKLLLVKSSCFPRRNYICMNLYSDFLTVNVNDELTERNAKIFILKNKTMTIECLATPSDNSTTLYISFKNHVIMTVSNQSRLVYDVDNAKCEDAGRYSCNVDYTDSGISVEHFIFIDMDCSATVTLSIGQMVATPSHHIMTSVGSDLSFNCTVNYAKEDFYLEIRKNYKVLTTQNDITAVTFNLSVTGCNDSDVYTCRYHQLHPEMYMKSTPLFIGVNNCPTHILSFGVTKSKNLRLLYHFDDAEPEADDISGAGEYRDPYYESVVHLVCEAETYSRPTTLLIKSESGDILKSQENSSIIDLSSSRMKCKDNGKVLCQITDHMRNETDSRTSHIWVRRCEPTLCRHQNHFKRLHPHVSHNATATFCFMMDSTLHTIHEKQMFHDGRLLETNSASKHEINIKADRTNPYQYILDVTLVNVQVEDFGQYLIHLKFNDKTVLTFLITVQNSVTIQSSPHSQFSPFMSYGLPCVIFLVLFLALVAIYSIVKKTKSCRSILNNNSNTGDVGQVMSDGFKYMTVREDEENTATN